MKRISDLRGEVEGWRGLAQRVADARELAELGDESLRADLEKEIDILEKLVDQRELRTLLSGDYDSGNALLSINAGAGGTDSQDWAEMLQRMYLRWAEAHDYETEILDTTEGEEAGIKSVTIAVDGRYAYGYLRPEKGVHRLVRLSPFDSNHRRHTSFAQVEVLPQVDDDAEVEVDPNDLKIETFRAAGAGGQNVQKNETAIRITHLPTGIVVACQDERSQLQNKLRAMNILRAKLYDMEQERLREEQDADRRSQVGSGDRSEKIRTYNFPQNRVTDHRIGMSSHNLPAILDGKLDEFIDELATREEADRLQAVGM